MTTKRNPRGSVTVCKRHGVLRLRLPRAAFGGQQKILTLGLPDNPENRRVAEIKAAEIQQDLAFKNFDPTLDKYRVFAPTIAIPGSYKLDEIFGNYIEHKTKFLAPSSLKNLKYARKNLQKCPYKQIEKASKIQHWFLDNFSQEAARRNLQQINAACEWAVEYQLIDNNPFSALPRIKRVKNHEIDPFSEEERDMIIDGFEADPYWVFYAPFVKFLFLTGCRTSEAVALTWDKISPEKTAITFSSAIVEGHHKRTKTGKIRTFPINDVLKQALPRRRKPDLLVFPSPNGLPIHTQNFTRRGWKPMLKKLGVRHRKLYATRHTFVTQCISSGVPINQVAAWVGNSPKIILEHYAGLVGMDVPEF